MHRYLSPITHRTGALVEQAPQTLLRADWIVSGLHGGIDFDDRTSLDAPSEIPSGSVRASDFPRLTIGIDYVERGEVIL